MRAVIGPGGQLGPYRLETPLGEGAMGLVFVATVPQGGRVAVKVLRPDLADDVVALARFTREARLSERSGSAHVVPILAAGRAGGLVYLAMPYYRGGSLAARVRSLGPLSVDEIAVLAAQLGRGLDALHEAGIVHRDVKPSNVLLDGEGNVALGDFGLARASDSTRVTEDGRLLGTPHYLAPELIEGAGATAASDVYALGCVLYECLAGAPPFAERTGAAIGFAHLAEAPPDPRTSRPELSGQIVESLLLALAKDPAARPTSATALARMLDLGRTSRRP
jgi:serine/threonine protein kinase